MHSGHVSKIVTIIIVVIIMPANSNRRIILLKLLSVPPLYVSQLSQSGLSGCKA